MVENKGLFNFIRNTSFLVFISYWIVAFILFGVIYFLSGGIFDNVIVDSIVVAFTVEGFFHGLYASFLIGTLIGYTQLVLQGFIVIFAYFQMAFSVGIILILIDKIYQKLSFKDFSHDKKINTLMLMMSIFRTDVDRAMHDIRRHSKKSISRHEIEALIDGLYVTFLDIEKYFRNHTGMKNVQYLMLTENIEGSLEKLCEFVEFLEKHEVSWKDRSVEFWLRYILQTAGNIANHPHKDERIRKALSRIRTCKEQLEEKLPR